MLTALPRLRPVRPARKNLVLLAAIVGATLAEPFVGHRSVATGAFFDALFALIYLYVVFVVFDIRWERRAAVVLTLPVFASSLAHYVLPHSAQVPAAVAFHSSVVLFLAFAVAAILRGIVRKHAIRGDDVAGALCGYLLGGLVWANLYALTYLLAPAAFAVNPEIVWRLGDWHLRRALFDYVSFTTLTSLGYADISPAGPPGYSLSWLEVMFGQFYMAVVVAQLVGLKLAQAMKGDGSLDS